MRFPAKHTTKIAGPPGTGKSTALLGIVDELLSRNIKADDIIYTTFTRAGANEARDRARVKFALPEEGLPWFRTIHSLCYHQVAHTGYTLMQPVDWSALAKKLGLHFTFRSDWEEGVPRGHTKGDMLMSLWSLSRVLMIPLREAYDRRDEWFISLPDLPFGELEHFVESTLNYKEAMLRVDFTDLLEIFLKEGTFRRPHVIVDEAQDLSPLQWKVIEKLCDQGETLHVAGDDDQCIYEWNGAVPRLFIDLHADKYVVLPRSYRVPARVHKFAEAVVHQITRRLPKEYSPREERGDLQRLPDLSALVLGPGTWFLLARNHSFLEEYVGLCRRQGLVYESPDNGTEMRILSAIRTWESLRKGVAHTAAEIHEVYRFMGQRDRVARGWKTRMAEAPKDKLLTLPELIKDWGCMTDKGWAYALSLIPEDVTAWLSQVEANGDLFTVPRIRISTIHGVKGKEADHVVLRTDMSYRTWAAYQRNADPEHRVWYVGSTRARQSLTIIQPDTALFYPL